MNTSTGPLIWRGVLAIAVGVIAVAWPAITVGAFVILFAVYAFLAAGMQASRAFRSDAAAGAVAGRLLLAALDAAAGAAALLWPGITALSLVLLLASWASVTGILEVGLAFRAGETPGQRAMLALTGLISISLGVVYGIRPDIGAVTLAQVYGLFSIVSGVSTLVMTANSRHNHRPVALASNASA